MYGWILAKVGFEMALLSGVFLLIVLGAIWLTHQAGRAALRAWYPAPSRLTVDEMPLLAALSILATWRSVTLLSSQGQPMALPVLAADLVAALILLVAVHRFR